MYNDFFFKNISKLCVLNICISEHSNIYVTPCMAVDGFPQPAFDGLWRAFRQKKIIKNVQLFVLFSFTLATKDCLYHYEPTRKIMEHRAVSVGYSIQFKRFSVQGQIVLTVGGGIRT
jgi:hypothetical protein